MQRGARAVRVGVIAAIVLVMVGAASATPWVVTLTIEPGRVENPQTPVPEMTFSPQAPVQQDPTIADTVGKVVGALFALVVVAAVAYGLYVFVQRLRAAWRPDEEAVEDDRLGAGDILGEVIPVDLAALATAVARADAHLAGLVEPGDAVIAAWVALEDEAALQGAGRDPAQTTT